MASTGERYLPDLAKCFAGEAAAFSWAEAFQALSENDRELNPRLLNTLISSSKVKNLLSQTVPSFSPPSQQSNSQVDSKIAAINTTSLTEHSKLIDEIKANTRWLSGEAKLAEDEALHIVILEWQQQPAERLLQGYCDAELSSLRDALNYKDASASQVLSQTFTKRNDNEFDLIEHKRLRLLNVFFREQIGLLGVARRLQELALLKNDTIFGSDHLSQFVRDLTRTTSAAVGVTDVVKTVDLRLRALEVGKDWSITIGNINDRWVASELHCIMTLQEILLLRMRASSETVPTETLLQWFQIVAGCEFFSNVQPGPLLLPSQVESLQAICALTTLAMLDPATALTTLADSASIDPSSYFLNGDAAHDLHRILLPAAEACLPQASPAALAWALVLGEVKHQGNVAKETRESGAVQKAIDQISTFDTATGRRTSSSSLQTSIYEEVLSSIMNTSDLSDPATYLLRCTIEAAHVFDTISILAKGQEYRSPLLRVVGLQILQELLSAAVSSIGYTSETIGSQFSILCPIRMQDIDLPDPRETFIKSDLLMDNIFAIAIGRFPYESLPFLRLCRLLAPAKIFDDQGKQYITFRLQTMDSYTQSATGIFASYHTVREDENLNLVVLDDTADMFHMSLRKVIGQGKPNNELNIIPTDTLGEVISESSPPVIRWHHAYSGLALVGAWLELHYLGHLSSALSPYENLEDIVTESVAIIATLLRNTTGKLPSNLEKGDRKRLQDELLGETSSILQTDRNIADCVFEILEQELQCYRRRPTNTFNTSVLVACIDFAAVFSQIRPDQFWSLLSRSSLLESYGSDSFLLSIVSGIEVSNQDFPFLLACTDLFHQVVRAALLQSRSNNGTIKTSKLRKTQPQTLRIHTNLLTSMTQSLYSAFEAIPGWVFAKRHQENEIVLSLSKSFGKIISYANGVEKSISGITSSLFPSSEFLAQQMCISSDDLSGIGAIQQHIFRAEELQISSKGILEADETHHALAALLSLSTTVLKLEKLRLMPPSVLDQQLFSAIPLFCRNIARMDNIFAIDLIQNLLDVIAMTEPASLLGSLGPTSAISLLQMLQLHLCESADNALKRSIWGLLAKLVGRNQQWLAIVVLTGSPPEKALKGDQERPLLELHGNTFMEIALRQLVRIVELDPTLVIAILKFMIKAQMNWSWANEAMRSNTDFLPAVMSYICNTYVDASDELKISHRNQIAALVTDLTTIHLHHAKAKRETTTLRSVAPLLRWLNINAIGVASYNHSLHSNLRKNFATRFNGFELGDFKRTTLFEPRYGDDYYYDLNLANEILSSEQQWDRNDRYRDQSFSAEFRRANLNLSVVDSEVKLLNSFLNICVEHSGYFAQDLEVQKTVVDIVKNALDANTRAYPSEKIFENVLQTRADMAIALLQRLVDSKAKGLEVRGLLEHAWESARSNNGSFEQAIVDNYVVYWRSMLTIILFTLQFQVDKRYMPPAANSSPAALLHHTEQAIPTILAIITVVIGQGFRSVAAALQDQKQLDVSNSEDSVTAVSHKDLHLILTIFETILRMPRLPEFVSEASQRLIAEGTIQSSLALYSWSHVLSTPELDHEPVHAAYCLQFLSSLSCLAPLTEELAVEGVLSRLLNARMTQQLQAVANGAAHLDRRPHVQSLYNLWATGLLPICLNLLHSVGPPVAAEVSIFLNQFPEQLNRASVAFIPSQSRSQASEALTSTVAKEAATLALISYILYSFRNAGASAAVDPSTIQPLGGYDEHKKALAEDISDVIHSTPASLRTRIAVINEQELALNREGNSESLVQKVVSELRNALTCLKGEDGEDEK